MATTEKTNEVTYTVATETETSSTDNSVELGVTNVTEGGKTTKDGKISLIPQPSDSPNDPLNWSSLKKNLVFISLLPGCFLTDWTLTWGSTLFPYQAMEWHMTVPQVANSLSGGIFMQGPGGLLAVPLCQRYGRLPVLFWCQFLSLVCTIGATFAPTYAGFTACRTLQGFFGAPPQVIGLSLIYDLFFFHERARKINIWAGCFLIGPYLGPFISALVVEKLTWRQTFGVLCGFYGFSVAMIVALGDETLYNRQNPVERTSKGVSGRIQLLLGITGAREAANRPTLWTTIKHQGALLARPHMFLPTFGFSMIATMWTIGIVSTIAEFVLPPPFLFSETQFALLFFAPMIGTLVAELWGHWFNDFLARRYIASHAGLHMPENRLWGVYPAWALGVIGLTVFGQAFQHNLSWVAVAFGWGLTTFCTLGTTTAISAYILDVFPKQAALASAWILMARVLGGFCVVYFQNKWVMRDGPGVAFGVQGGIIGAAIISIIAVQVFGASWRKRFPVEVLAEEN